MIPMEVLEELKYTDFRKKAIFNLKEGFTDINLDENSEQDKANLIDQLIRNNPKAFTPAPFEDNMVEEYKQGKSLPNTVNFDLNKLSGRKSEIILSNKDGVIRAPEYIRIYDKAIKRTLLFKRNTNVESLTYDKIEMLGRKGFVLEINPSIYINTSALSSNNVLKSNVKPDVTYDDNLENNQNEFDETESPEEQYIPSAEDQFGLNDEKSEENQDGIFGKVSNPTESDLNSISEEEGTSDKPEEC